MNKFMAPLSSPGAESPAMPPWVADLSLLASIFDNLPLGVLVINLEGRILYCNDAQAKIDDMEKSFIVGKLEKDIYGPYLGPGIMRACQQTGQPLLGYVCHYRTVRGKIINGAYWVYPCYANGEVRGSLCLTQMLSNKKRVLVPGDNIDAEDSAEQEVSAESGQIIIGSDPAFRKAMSVIQTTANSPSAVLIAGETGTGKEMFAQAVRIASNRRNKAYQAINCSAIPATLLEGILFGATKGSFTGAVERPGLFEEANGGIIYLDEIDSMPLGLQPKLLRVLQEMRVRRLGSALERPIDVKIISSISTNPAEALASGRLRPDLYYRLAIITVIVPPLRERMGDIDDLTSHFMIKYNQILKKNVSSIDSEVRAFLHDYHWPGNVRELEHVIAGAINLTAWEKTLHMHHIPDHHRLSMEPGRAAGYRKERLERPSMPIVIPAASNPLPEPARLDQQPGGPSLAAAEMEIIAKTLQNTRGRISQAAAILGISRQLLSYKMKKHGLARELFIRPLGQLQ